MKEFWESRYAQEEYAYGVNPNQFLKECLEVYTPKGKILFPAEGEGRNAVFSAKKGLETFAFDISYEGQKKALNLANQEGVNINYQVGDFFELPLINERYDAVGLVFAHLPPSFRKKYHAKIGELIEPGGYVFLEGFSVGHLEYHSRNPLAGGPKTVEMLFTMDQIKNEFPDFEIVQLEEVETHLAEGAFHQGESKVIRFVGRKNNF
jgi:SAM-dependent methyltransferase